ncbi:copia protein [Tanacetum coccineum]
MSSMGELTFFLGLQFNYTDVKSASTPTNLEKPLVKDADADDLVAYTDSDYAGATLDRKSTTGGCQFLGNRLISWQCKKQTVVATSTTEAEYVAAASCCGQHYERGLPRESSGQEDALFPTMLAVPAPSTSPSRITSSPSPTPS